MIKLFLDDVRPAPEGWMLVTNVEDAKLVLKKYIVTHLSLDHDLGENVQTGYDLVKWIEERYFVHDIKPPEMKIHSANPVGRQNMQRAIDAMARLARKVG